MLKAWKNGGGVKVASTDSRAPCALAISAKPSISATLVVGFPMDSVWISLVLGFMALRTASKSPMLTKVA
ncbi:hypothetical protein D3C80_1769330 [compost metagenome]